MGSGSKRLRRGAEAAGLVHASAMIEVGGWLEIAVQHQRIEIGAVRPDNGPELFVNTNLRKVIGVCERFEHRAAQLSR